MINLERRAEKQCIDALLSDPTLAKIYGAKGIFQGYVAPNTLESRKEYLYVKRISAVSLDRGCVDGTPSGNLRRVRLQVDVSDVNYVNMVERSELVRRVLTKAYPPCIDGDTYGIVQNGQKVMNVSSIDVILIESEV
jgi:hypothetical protein